MGLSWRTLDSTKHIHSINVIWTYLIKHFSFTTIVSNMNFYNLNESVYCWPKLRTLSVSHTLVHHTIHKDIGANDLLSQELYCLRNELGQRTMCLQIYNILLVWLHMVFHRNWLTSILIHSHIISKICREDKESLTFIVWLYGTSAKFLTSK